MDRREFLAVGATAVVFRGQHGRSDYPLPADYEPYDTSAFYHPSILKAKHVDPGIWPAVRAINQSGWVWTLESCEGHPDRYAWSHVPLIRLAVPHGHAERMLGLLHRSAPEPRETGRGGNPNAITVVRHVAAPMPGWFEARVSVDGPDPVRVFETFAARL
jgi:hypothetical protein